MNFGIIEEEVILVRLLDQKAFEELYKRDTIQAGLFFSGLTGVILFVLFVGAGFGTALIAGIVVFGLLFGMVYGLRMMIFKGFERRKAKQAFDAPHIEVTLRRELGMLVFYSDVIRFVSLSPGTDTKDFDIPITPNLFIGTGQIQFSKFQSYRKKGIEEGFVLVKEMPHGMFYQFQFYRVGNNLDEVTNVVNGITQYVDQG
jgi:hypothetical protein